jgi:type II secretory pathway pseudopilin PulG
MRRRKLRNSGFTLAELLLVCAILALTLTALLALFINCSILNEANRNLTIAVSHASYIMEEIRGAGFTGLEARINDNGWDLNKQQIQSVYSLTPLDNEAISTSVTQSGNPLGVSVRVDWFDRRQRPRNIVLNTLITDYP